MDRAQHAYFPTKGVQTALRDVWKKLFKEKNIYEFDLKGFFDSVNLLENEKILQATGIPP